MRLLLDTCTFIWLTQAPKRLSPAARSALDDPSNELYFSHVSIWEIFNKCQAGKLVLPDTPRVWVAEQLAARGVAEWPIDLPSLERMSELPLHHRDPFDRLLVAQSIVHGLCLVSPDPAFPPYGARMLW
ncbi:MAG: type II toxin-antitoxin system VapC family toxin [Myxococcales bacterium]|nr:type II toxin-antitoxin system VapC family toxin [Myxococcales bacterium]